MFKLLVDRNNVYEGPSLMMLIKQIVLILPSDANFEIWEKKRTQWRLVDGGFIKPTAS